MSLISLLVTLLILCLIFSIAVMVVRALIDPPFLKIAHAILGVIFLLVLLGLVFGGISIPHLRH